MNSDAKRSRNERWGRQNYTERLEVMHRDKERRCTKMKGLENNTERGNKKMREMEDGD